MASCKRRVVSMTPIVENRQTAAAVIVIILCIAVARHDLYTSTSRLLERTVIIPLHDRHTTPSRIVPSSKKEASRLTRVPPKFPEQSQILLVFTGKNTTILFGNLNPKKG